MGTEYQQVDDATEGELTQWELLQQRMRARSREPTPSDAEVDKLLKSIFRDHALADHPDFTKYFKNDRRGKTMEDRLLRKAAAAHSHHSSNPPPKQQPQPAQQQAQQQPQKRQTLSVVSSAGRRALDLLRRGLARYRAWRPRAQLYLLLSCPEYSTGALIISALMMGVIVLNTVTFCIESVPSLEHTRLYDRLMIVDYVCLGIFTTEFMLRLLTCNDVVRFARKPMNWVDLVAIAPFLMELAVAGPDSQNASQTRIFRLVRLLRLLRFLRASSRFRNLQLVVDALANSLDVIGMLVVLMCVMLVVAGSVVYYMEDALVKDTWFDSIPLTIYYMHVTLTTTGYGEYYAQSAWGRFVVGCFMLLCMVTVSLPIGVVGGNFSGLWTRYCTLRAAIDRSADAWATRARLRGLAARHCAAVDELLTITNWAKTSLEEGSRRRSGLEGTTGEPGSEGLRPLRDDLVALQGRLVQMAAEGAGECLQDTAQLAALRDSILDLRRRLADVADRFGNLQALLSLVPRVSSPDVAASLEDVHAVHQTLAAGSAEGLRQAGRCRLLLADLRAMKDVVQAEEEEVYGGFEAAFDGDEDGGGGVAQK